MRDNCRLNWPRCRTAGRAAALAVIKATVAALATGCGTTVPHHAAPVAPVQPMRVSSAQLARLPAATTYAATLAAPTDPYPDHLQRRARHRRPARLAGPRRVRSRGQRRLRPGSPRRAARAVSNSPRKRRHDHQLVTARPKTGPENTPPRHPSAASNVSSRFRDD